MNKIIKEALVLMAITLVSGLLLGAVYSITKQPIAQAEEKSTERSLSCCISGCTGSDGAG